MVKAEVQALSIEVSPAIQDRLKTYCLTHGLEEREVVKQAVLRLLECEEEIEQCFQNWEKFVRTTPQTANQLRT